MRRTTAIVVAVIAAMTLTLTACGGSARTRRAPADRRPALSRKGDPEDRDDELHRLFQPVELHRVPGVQRLHHGLSPARPVRLQGRRIHDCGRPRSRGTPRVTGRRGPSTFIPERSGPTDSPSPRTTSRGRSTRRSSTPPGRRPSWPRRSTTSRTRPRRPSHRRHQLQGRRSGTRSRSSSSSSSSPARLGAVRDRRRQGPEDPSPRAGRGLDGHGRRLHR